MMEAALQRQIDRREAVVARIKEILVGPLHVRRTPHEIDPDTPLFGTGLRLDSLDAVELWVQLGDVFGLQLPNDLARRITSTRTINSLADLVLSTEARP
jgi:acyl carrier protein